MTEQHKYYIVDSSVLPEVFTKVLFANKLLRTGEAKNTTTAAKLAGISRSVYYKYKDSIRPFYDKNKDKIVTIYALLEDSPGVLSTFLSVLASEGANILTINQNIPINSLAPITASIQTSGLVTDIEELISRISGKNGVISAEILASET